MIENEQPRPGCACALSLLVVLKRWPLRSEPGLELRLNVLLPALPAVARRSSRSWYALDVWFAYLYAFNNGRRQFSLFCTINCWKFACERDRGSSTVWLYRHWAGRNFTGRYSSWDSVPEGSQLSCFMLNRRRHLQFHGITQVQQPTKVAGQFYETLVNQCLEKRGLLVTRPKDTSLLAPRDSSGSSLR